MTDSPEPFLYRLGLPVLLSLAAAALVPVDMAFDEEADSSRDIGPGVTPVPAGR